MKKIVISKDGPYLVSADIKLKKATIKTVNSMNEVVVGETIPTEGNYDFCRCGRSKNSPFCDGSHKVSPVFNGTETADKSPYNERSELQEGEYLDLRDDGRCAFARTCHQPDGDAWNLAEYADNKEMYEEAINIACSCPSGRLTAQDKDGNQYEIEYEPTILVVEDPQQGCAAGLFVQGQVALESESGDMYETRNRYALCRCGGSENKPFCDAMHVNMQFSPKGKKE